MAAETIDRASKELIRYLSAICLCNTEPLSRVGALQASYYGLHEWLGLAWYWLVHRG
jgi:hypothetical protein